MKEKRGKVRMSVWTCIHKSTCAHVYYFIDYGVVSLYCTQYVFHTLIGVFGLIVFRSGSSGHWWEISDQQPSSHQQSFPSW